MKDGALEGDNDRTAAHRHLQTLHYHRYYTGAAMDLVFIMPIYENFFFLHSFL